MLETGHTYEWLSILFAVSVKSVIILAAAGLMTRTLHGASARLRHMLWCGSLFSLLLLPLFSAGFQPLQVPVLPFAPLSTEFANQASPKVADGSRVPNSVTLPFDENSLGTENGVSQVPFSWRSLILFV